MLIGEDSWVGPNSSIAHISVGDRSNVTLGAVATKNVAEASRVSGNFAIDREKFLVHRKSLQISDVASIFTASHTQKEVEVVNELETQSLCARRHAYFNIQHKLKRIEEVAVPGNLTSETTRIYRFHPRQMVSLAGSRVRGR